MTTRDLLTGLIGAVLGAMAYAVVGTLGGSDAGETVESFFIGFPQDGVALTNNGKMFLAPLPEGIAQLSEPALKTSMAILGKIRNMSDEVVGFASELEVFPDGPVEDFWAGKTIWDTVWTVVIPGRGTLFLAQQERSGTFASDVLGPALEKGEDWSGEYDMTTTVGPGANGRGVIVGGTGEFENAAGAFTESNHFTGFKMNGTLTTVHELKVFRKQ